MFPKTNEVIMTKCAYLLLRQPCCHKSHVAASLDVSAATAPLHLPAAPRVVGAATTAIFATGSGGCRWLPEAVGW